MLISISTRNEIFFSFNTYQQTDIKRKRSPNCNLNHEPMRFDDLASDWLKIGAKSLSLVILNLSNGASIWFSILHCRANKYNHEVFVCDFKSLGSAVSLFRRFINLVAVALIYVLKEKKTKALLIEQDRQFLKTRGIKFLSTRHARTCHGIDARSRHTRSEFVGSPTC